MKKLIMILLASALFISVGAQTKRVYSPDFDTLNGNETVYIPVLTSTSSLGITIQALCTQLGGTSDGSLVLQGSADGTSYLTINDDDVTMTAYPNDTLTITNGAVVQWVILKNAWKSYRIKGVGTASDTTLITPKYIAY